MDITTTIRLLLGAVSYPAFLGAIVFSIGALSRYDEDNCHIGGVGTNSTTDEEPTHNLDHYVIAVKLVLVTTTSVGLMCMVLASIFESMKRVLYVIGSVMLHGTVVSFLMALYALASADCQVSTDITTVAGLTKDNDITYVAVFVTVLFGALGVASMPVHGQELTGGGSRVLDSSVVKMIDVVLRIAGFAMAMQHIRDKEGVHVHYTGPEEHGETNLTTVCTSAIDGIRNHDGNTFVAYDTGINDHLIFAGLIITACELFFRLSELVYKHALGGDTTVRKTYSLIGLEAGFKYFSTIASHTLAGIVLASVIQLSLYEECEVFDKDASFRNTIILLIASCITTVLHLQTLDIEHMLLSGEGSGTSSMYRGMFS